VRALVLAAMIFGSAGTAPALADTPALPSLPPGIVNNPIVQSVINAVGGLFQTTNGPTAHGTVSYMHRFDLQLQTAPSVYREIHLHQGTVINPRGLTLEPGMVVHVSGDPQSDGSLNANVITLVH